MHFEPGSLYHIYNRGNNQQFIYHNRENYLYFLNKVHQYITPRCSILAWCLMPNHFHFLVHTDERSCTPVPKILIPSQHLTEGIRLLLSSYSKGINNQQQTTGNVFQQKTKAKCINEGENQYDIIAFHYIHQNPKRAGLVIKMEEYEFSSFPDYLKMRNGALCNKKLAYKLLELNDATLYTDSYQMLEGNIIDKIF
jgi:REP element-mobilizing transposase RayT